MQSEWLRQYGMPGYQTHCPHIAEPGEGDVVMFRTGHIKLVEER